MTFTKEQLINHIEGVVNTFTEAVRTYPDNIGLKMDLRTAEIALAALKAKPVPGLFMKCTEIEPCPGKETIVQAMPMADGKYHDSCFHLYDVPPSQVMPEELLSAMEDVLRISDRDHDAWHKAKCAIASCRATMRRDGNGKDESFVCD